MGSDKREPLARVLDIAPVRDAVAALDAMLAAFYGKPPPKDRRARMVAVLGMLEADDDPAPRACG